MSLQRLQKEVTSGYSAVTSRC